MKDDIKKDKAERVWNQIFKPDLNLGKLGILYIWKQKYLFPYGNITAINEFENQQTDNRPNQKSQSSLRSRSQQPDQPQHDETTINKTFDNLVHNKYRMTVDDIGGEVMARHWIEEISKPISITQFEINQDLQRLGSTFPIDVIPYKS